MIGYVCVGTKNLEKASKFYDEVLAVLGAERSYEIEKKAVFWTTGEGEPGFSVILPYDDQPATAGNGTMVALKAESLEQIKKVYDKAIELGAEDAGKPGVREEGFSAAYFRDLDGNKINIHCFG